MSTLKKFFAALVALFVVSTLSASPAQAVNNDTITVYYDAPFVQGSYTTSTGGTQETFDTATTGTTCPSSLVVGTMTGSCRVDPVGPYGGADTTAGSSVAVGGSGSRYATTVSGGAMTLTLANPAKYFGFWWSAGSNGNTVQFYSGNELLITLSTQTIISQFGAFPSPWPGSNTFTAIDASTYNKGWYFGNPRGYSSTTPSSASTITTNEPFVYLHLFAGGNLTFDKVVLSGAGFEFDNLAVATTPQTVNPRLVLAQTLYSNHSVTFNSNTGSGNMSDQVANSSTALTSNSFTKAGYTFTGWNTQANGSGTAYTNQEVYSFDLDLDLYAQWQLTPYNVTYNSQGGSSVSGQTYTMGSTINLASPPTRAGYTFKGWFTSATGGSALGSTYSPPGTGNITLYAQWEDAPVAELALTGSKTLTPLWIASMLLMAGFAFVSASWATKLKSVKNS
jgi:uncharacterized repeat protein (TIGR02543 family)